MNPFSLNMLTASGVSHICPTWILPRLLSLSVQQMRKRTSLASYELLCTAFVDSAGRVAGVLGIVNNFWKNHFCHWSCSHPSIRLIWTVHVRKWRSSLRVQPLNCFCLTQFGRRSLATVNLPACSSPIDGIRLTQQARNHWCRAGCPMIKGLVVQSPAPLVRMSWARHGTIGQASSLYGSLLPSVMGMGEREVLWIKGRYRCSHCFCLLVNKLNLFTAWGAENTCKNWCVLLVNSIWKQKGL